MQLNRQGKTKDLGNEREQEVRALAPQDGRKKADKQKKPKMKYEKSKRKPKKKKNAKQSKAKRSETKTRSHFGFRLSRSKAADKGGHNRKAIINK